MWSLAFPAAIALAIGGVGASSPTVTLSAGTLQGGTCDTFSDAVYFKSIPFANAPTGNLRFAAPQAYSDKFSGGTLNATAVAPSCTQFDPLFAEAGPTSEDCLFINVWAPSNATKSSGLPVRVWLYGGSNSAGGISDPLYDGCAVASSGAILVSINYRLGPLGFFVLPDAGYEGNQGIQDALLGLQWVQDNIEAFGGDTKKVLLHGESAGAIDSYTIATLEKAPQLFGSAIFESGGGLEISLQEAVQNSSTTLTQSLKCGTNDTSCLQGKSVDDIMTAYGHLPTYNGSSTPSTPGFAPSVDGKVIPSQPTEQWVRVPSIFGSNLQEGTLFTFAQYLSDPSGLGAATAADYDTYLEQNFGSAASKIKAQYPLSAFNSTAFPPIYAISQIVTAYSFLCPARRGLEAAVKNGIPVWTYRFSHAPTCSWEQKIPQYGVPLLGATHSSEIAFVFGQTTGLPLPNGTCNMTDQEQQISSFMLNAWTTMASQQKPGNSTDWPAWTDANTSLGINIINGSEPGLVNYTECDLWDSINQMASTNTTSNSSATSSSPSAAATTSSTGGSNAVFPSMGMMLITAGALAIFESI